MNFRKGQIVRPNHTGQDCNGRPINWGVYKGRVVCQFTQGNREIAEVVWFGEGRLMLPKNYPVDDLELSA